MEAVGDACEQQGQLETARELYLAAPNPCAALRIMNRQLSDLIKPAITDEAAGMMLVHATPLCAVCSHKRGQITATLFEVLAPCGAGPGVILHENVNLEQTGIKSLLLLTSSMQATAFIPLCMVPTINRWPQSGHSPMSRPTDRFCHEQH